MKAFACALALVSTAHLVAQDATQAERLFREGDHAAALRAYAAAAEGATGVRGAMCYGAGVAALRSGALPDAVLWFERAARRLQDPQPARRGIAFAQRSLGVANASAPVVEPTGCDPAQLAFVVVAQTVGLLCLILARSRGGRAASAALAVGGLLLTMQCALQQFASLPAIAVTLRDATLQSEPGGASIAGATIAAGARLVVFERRADSVRVGPPSGWLPAGSFGVADER